MRTSGTINKIAEALLGAQKEMENASKDALNPFHKSKYADLNAVLEVSKSTLNKHGIVLLQPVMGNKLETHLIHTSGEFLISETEIVMKSANDPQAQGSAITYARRYGLQSFLAIGAEDDDGNSAAKKEVKDNKKEEIKTVYNPTDPASAKQTDLMVQWGYKGDTSKLTKGEANKWLTANKPADYIVKK